MDYYCLCIIRLLILTIVILLVLASLDGFVERSQSFSSVSSSMYNSKKLQVRCYSSYLSLDFLRGFWTDDVLYSRKCANVAYEASYVARRRCTNNKYCTFRENDTGLLFVPSKEINPSSSGPVPFDINTVKLDASCPKLFYYQDSYRCAPYFPIICNVISSKTIQIMPNSQDHLHSEDTGMDPSRLHFLKDQQGSTTVIPFLEKHNEGDGVLRYGNVLEALQHTQEIPASYIQWDHHKQATMLRKIKNMFLVPDSKSKDPITPPNTFLVMLLRVARSLPNFSKQREKDFLRLVVHGKDVSDMHYQHTRHLTSNELVSMYEYMEAPSNADAAYSEDVMSGQAESAFETKRFIVWVDIGQHCGPGGVWWFLLLAPKDATPHQKVLRLLWPAVAFLVFLVLPCVLKQALSQLFKYISLLTLAVLLCISILLLWIVTRILCNPDTWRYRQPKDLCYMLSCSLVALLCTIAGCLSILRSAFGGAINSGRN